MGVRRHATHVWEFGEVHERPAFSIVEAVIDASPTGLPGVIEPRRGEAEVGEADPTGALERKLVHRHHHLDLRDTRPHRVPA